MKIVGPIVIALTVCAQCVAEESPVTFDHLPLGEITCAVVTCAPEEVRLHWKDAEGTPYGNVDRLRADYEKRGEPIIFATNAGMFTPEFAPAGLHVEAGKKLRDLNTNEGPGNFHMMPNGVFYIDDEGGRVCTTEQYRQHEPKPRLATQSGPMLVIDDELHPAFNEGSPNLRVRSGVGVDNEGRVVFAISEAQVNFHDFATFFRDTLKCKNALYLDGALSFFYAPAMDKNFSGGAYGGLIAIASDTKDDND